MNRRTVNPRAVLLAAALWPLTAGSALALDGFLRLDGIAGDATQAV